MYEYPNVILINLISKAFLQRFQAPVAIVLLSGYLKAKLPDISVTQIDMQKIFETYNSRGKSDTLKSYKRTINETIKKIYTLVSHQQEKTVIGFSMKWQTQDETKEIIRRVYEFVSKDQVLFVLGNLMSTFSYQDMLTQPGLENVLAVVGEGEDALVDIIKNSKVGPIDLSKYEKIANVAYSQEGVIARPKIKRVNLKKYPSQIITDASDLYDSEYGVFAYETSRGCAWNSCTFCSIKNQFGNFSSKEEGVQNWTCYPVEKVLEDIQSFVKQGARIFDFKDSEFFGPIRSRNGLDPFEETTKRIEALAEGLIKINEKLEEKISINHISVRVDTIYREGEDQKNERKKSLYKLLKRAGLKGVYLGIESGSSSQLKRYCKGSTVEENKNASVI